MKRTHYRGLFMNDGNERTGRIVMEKNKDDQIWQRLGNLNQEGKLTFEIVAQAGIYAIFHPISAISATHPLKRLGNMLEWFWTTPGWTVFWTALGWVIFALFLLALFPFPVAVDAAAQAVITFGFQTLTSALIIRWFIKLFI